jgi:hypothetical protein
VIPLVPGEYLFDIPDTDGSLTALCRCPVCRSDFRISQEGKPEVCKGFPVALECLHCGHYDTYRSANYRAGAVASNYQRRAKVRRCNRNPDTPLFSEPLYRIPSEESEE